MSILKVRLKKKIDYSYRVLIKSGAVFDLVNDLKNGKWGGHCVIVSDFRVKKVLADKLFSKIKQTGVKVDLISLRGGEKSKNLETLAELQKKLLLIGADRNSVLIAVGGGVVGDMTGFLAATYMRGVPYLQVPTTLLGMVDSSVGGKTGANLPEAKNLVGVFHQPRKIYIDLDLLDSLSARQFASGMAEVIKIAVTCNRGFFRWLEKKAEHILARKKKFLTQMITKSVALKAEIVEEDEREKDVRMILNFGHTIGHVLETITDYGTYTHGEAVAMGMVWEAELAWKLGLTKEREIERIKSLLKIFNLPVNLPTKISAKELLETAHSDKKKRDGNLPWILLKRIGKVKIRIVPGNEILRVMKQECFKSFD